MPLLEFPQTTVSGLSDASVIDHTDAMTLAAGTVAFDVTALSAGGRQGLVSKDASHYGEGGHLTIWLVNGRIEARIQTDDSSVTVSGGSLAAGQPAHVALGFGPDGLALYVDGVAVDTDPYGGGLIGNAEPLVIGASQWASTAGTADALAHEFRGEIGPVQIHDSQLSAAEIAALAADGPTDPDSGGAPPPETPPAAVVQAFEAEAFDATLGVGVFTQGGNRQIGSTQDGEWVRYDAVAFGDDPDATQTLDLTLSSGSGGGTLELRIGAPDGTLLAEYTTGNTGGWASYDDVTLDLGSVTGEQDLYFVFRGGARSIMDIDTFTLTTAATDPAEPGGNAAPVVVVPDTGQQLSEGESKSIDIAHLFRDPDGDSLTYALRNAPDFITLEGTIVTVAPGFEDAGIYEIDVIASDGALSSGPATIVYEVADATPPLPSETVQAFEAEDFDATQGVGVFTQGGNRQIGSTQDGEWVRYDAVSFGDDPDATQTLDLRLSSGSGGGTLEVRLGAPDGTLLAEYSTGNTGGWASYDDVTLDLGSVTGDQDLYFVFRGGARSIMDIDAFTLTTRTGDPVEPGNQAPVATPPFTDLTRPENSAGLYNVTIAFADPDGDALTYTIVSAPDFVTFSESGTFLSIRPEDGDDGTYTVSVVASDGSTVSDPWTFALTVEDTVDPPSDNAAPFVAVPDTGQIVAEGDSRIIDVAHLFRDPDADPLSYELRNAPDFVTIDGTVVTVAPDYDDAGLYEVEVIASDGTLSSGPASIVYEVTDAAPPQTGAVRLDASATALTRNPDGSYDWADGVVLTGYQRDGEPAEVVFSTQFRDHGFGVRGEGSRWDGQIDFYDVNGGESETLVIDFASEVDDLVLTVGMLGAGEGGGGLDETGTWLARDAGGAVIGTGLIGPELSALGPDVKLSGSYGIYPIAIGIDGVASLELAATQFGHGAGASRTAGYGENSSDFNVMALDFTTASDVFDFV